MTRIMAPRKRIITYGTFDLFHIGHLNLLERASRLGDELFVGVSTDEFNQTKDKLSTICFENRAKIVSALRPVTKVFPEEAWNQKEQDISYYGIDCFVMGDDWFGKFDYLKSACEVIYLSRTPNISSTKIKRDLQLARGSR